MVPGGATSATIANATDATALINSLPPGPGGKLNVRVSVDTNGKVTEAEVVAGPGNVCPTVATPEVNSIREAGKKAAEMVRFAPAKVGDVPVDSVGWIYFETKPARYELFTVKGDRNYSAVELSKKTETSSNSTAEDQGDGRKILSGGVLEGRAVELPKPSYPPAARAVRATGSVEIQVLILEDGSVFEAEAKSGHPLLRSSARLAACSAKFHPTSLERRPVRVAGIITYNFVP